MKLLSRVTIGWCIGYLYSEKLGYTFKIKTKIKNKMEIVNMSYIYYTYENMAYKEMIARMQILTKQQSIFNILDYYKKG